MVDVQNIEAYLIIYSCLTHVPCVGIPSIIQDLNKESLAYKWDMMASLGFLSLSMVIVVHNILHGQNLGSNAIEIASMAHGPCKTS